MSAGGNAIDKLILALEVDPSGMKKGLKEAEKSVDKSVKEQNKKIDQAVQDMQHKLVGGFKSMVAAVGLGGFLNNALGAVMQSFEAFENEAVQAQKLGKLIGMTTEEFSAMAKTAKASGVEIDQLAQMFVDLRKNAKEFTDFGSGPMKRLVDGGFLDPSQLLDANGQLKTTEGLMMTFADLIHDAGDNGAALADWAGIHDKNAIALLSKGSMQLRQLTEAQRKAGVVTDREADSVMKLKKSKKELTDLVNRGLLVAFKAIIPIMNGIAAAISFVQKHWIAFMPAMAGVLWYFRIAIWKQAAAGIGTAAKALKALLNIKGGPVIMALVALGLLIEDFIVWVNGGESALGEMWEAIFGPAEGVKQTFADIMQWGENAWNTICDAANSFIDTLKSVWNWLKNIGAVWDGFKDGWENFKANAKAFISPAFSASGAMNTTRNYSNVKGDTNTTIDQKNTFNLYGGDKETANTIAAKTNPSGWNYRGLSAAKNGAM